MIEHLTPYTLSPTNLIAGRSTREWEGHKTKTHALVARAGCVDHIRKNDRYTQLDDFSCNGRFANVIHTHSARDVRVRLGLVTLHSQVERRSIRSVGDTVFGVRCPDSYFIRTKQLGDVPIHKA